MYFEQNQLYQELPQNLQYRVVKIVLKFYMKTFEYFFEDFRSKNKAPLTFMVGVLTKLDCQLYDPGEVILEAKKPIEELIMVHQGYCNLYGFQPSKDGGTLEKHLIVRLPRRSWYGEF